MEQRACGGWSQCSCGTQQSQSVARFTPAPALFATVWFIDPIQSIAIAMIVWFGFALDCFYWHGNVLMQYFCAFRLFDCFVLLGCLLLIGALPVSLLFLSSLGMK